MVQFRSALLVQYLSALDSHTVSGDLSLGKDGNPILSAFADRSNLQFSLTEMKEDAGRNTPDGRWLVKYTKGVMDVDALSDLVYYELYVPVTVKKTDEPIELARSWTFPAVELALFLSRFDAGLSTSKLAIGLEGGKSMVPNDPHGRFARPK